MATDAQVQANRFNARKSTGPRTQEGKAKAAQNAIKHGLFSRTAFLHGEDWEEFVYHREGLVEEIAPDGLQETDLAGRIAGLSWRLKRAERYQNAVFEALYEKYLARQAQAAEADGDESGSPSQRGRDARDTQGQDALATGEQGRDARDTQGQDGLGTEGQGRDAGDMEAQGQDALATGGQGRDGRDTQEQNALGTDMPADPAVLGRLLLEDFAGERVLERALLYERRIANSLYRAMTELRQLRRQPPRATPRAAWQEYAAADDRPDPIWEPPACDDPPARAAADAPAASQALEWEPPGCEDPPPGAAVAVTASQVLEMDVVQAAQTDGRVKAEGPVCSVSARACDPGECKRTPHGVTTNRPDDLLCKTNPILTDHEEGHAAWRREVASDASPDKHPETG